MKHDHPNFLRLHEVLNLLTDTIDDTRKWISLMELYSKPSENLDVASNPIFLIGMYMLRQKYIDNLSKLDAFKEGQRIKIRANHLECIEQLTALISSAPDPHTAVANLLITLKSNECTSEIPVAT